MTSLLTGIIASALLSITSLLIVLYRVSPLTAPGYALPAFFLSMLLSVGSVTTLLCFVFWKLMPTHWDAGKMLSISLREGSLVAIATVILILFHILALLNWWIAILIYAAFLLIELAMHT